MFKSSKKFETINDGKLWGEKKYGNWYRSIKQNKEILNAFKNYTGGTSMKYNEALKQEDLKDSPFLYDIQYIHNELKKAPKLHQDTTVYKFINKYYADKIVTANKLKPFRFVGFNSTSLTSIRVEKFDDDIVLLKINAKKKSSCGYVAPISTNNIFEQELLFNCNTLIWSKKKRNFT